jgi:DNA-binding SARP family transcriptional activator/Tfp pilus assembly protein PilF
VVQGRSSSAPGVAGGAAPWTLKVLGGAALAGTAARVDRLERKTAALLALLAIAGPTPRSRLAGLLWPDASEEQARANLRKLLHRRGREYPALLNGGEPLALGSVETDVARFLDDDPAVEAALPVAGELLAGYDYDDCPEFDEWLLVERERIRERTLRALVGGAERHELAGRLESALDLAGRLVDLDPLSETAHRRVMRLHYLLGDRAAALQAYERCRRVLASLAGLEPLAETVDLARTIDRGAPSEPPARSAPAVPIELARPPRLVGRRAEWQALERAWPEARAIWISGHAGVGKTRLLTEFLAPLALKAVLTGFPGDEAVPYGGLARALRESPGMAAIQTMEGWVQREAARLLPELPAGEPPGRIQSPGPQDRRRLVDALIEILESRQEGRPLVVEDLHYLDADSLALLEAWLARAPGEGAPRLIATYRSDQLSVEARAELARQVAAGTGTEIALGPLPEAAVRELLTSLPGGDPNDAGWLLRLTGGIPLFIVECLKSLWEEGAVGGDQGARGVTPPRLAALLEDRLRRLSPLALDLARVRAVAGESYQPAAAAEMLEVPLAMVAAAGAELAGAQVLVDRRFPHELVERAVRDGISPDLLPILHERVARVLEARDAEPEVVARHWQGAGRLDLAGPHFLAAMRRAASLFAGDRADELLQLALAATSGAAHQAETLLAGHDELVNLVSTERSEGLLEQAEGIARRLQDERLLVEVRVRQGERALRRGDTDRAGALAEMVGEQARRTGDAGIARRGALILASTRFFSGDFAGAAALADEAARDAEGPLRLRALNLAASALGMLGRIDEAQAGFESALTIARQDGDAAVALNLLNNLAANAEHVSDYAGALRWLDEAILLARERRDPGVLASMLANRAAVLTLCGPLAEALSGAEDALEVALAAGAERTIGRARQTLAEVHRNLDSPQAQELFDQAARDRAAGGDRAGALMSRFNAAALRAELLGADLEDAGRVLEEFGVANPQFVSAGWLDLALIAGDPERARTCVARAEANRINALYRRIALIARFRASVLARECDPEMAGRLSEALAAGPSRDASLGQALLVCHWERIDRDEAGRQGEQFERVLAREVVGLPPELAAGRRRHALRRTGLEWEALPAGLTGRPGTPGERPGT